MSFVRLGAVRIEPAPNLRAFCPFFRLRTAFPRSRPTSHLGNIPHGTHQKFWALSPAYDQGFEDGSTARQERLYFDTDLSTSSRSWLCGRARCRKTSAQKILFRDRGNTEACKLVSVSMSYWHLLASSREPRDWKSYVPPQFSQALGLSPFSLCAPLYLHRSRMQRVQPAATLGSQSYQSQLWKPTSGHEQDCD